MRSRLLCGAIAGGLALTGCGEDPPLREAQGADRRQMETAVEGWLAGLADGDGKAACSHLTGDARDHIKDSAGVSSCEEAVKRVSDQLFLEARKTLKETVVTRAFTRGDSGEAELDGDTTFGTPTGAGPVPLQKVDGTWKIAGFVTTEGPENPVGTCIAGGLQEFERGEAIAYWKREGRADFRAYVTALCKRADEQSALEANGDIDPAVVDELSDHVLLRMIRRGQVRDPR